MTKNRIIVALAGVALGLIGAFSTGAATQAVADSPWDTPKAHHNVVLADPGLCRGCVNDSPWD